MMTRREHAGGLLALLSGQAPAAIPEYGAGTLPAGIRSRFVGGVNGLRIHCLEAGFETTGRPCVLLLHGFPELAYSWRKVMPALARAGYHVIAPDQRGYGRTTGWKDGYDADPAPFRLLNVVRDALGLVWALGYRSVAGVVGHDYGSPVAAWCGLLRPDVFRAVVLMSAPFGGPPAAAVQTARGGPSMPDQLAALSPPRKHYQWYYSTSEANGDMLHCPQGVHAFLRAYFHYKSGDWAGNRPFELKSWSAAELAKLPTYYVMDLHKGMGETVAPYMPSRERIAACRWLTEDELRVFSTEFRRTGFQGGLQWYRSRTEGLHSAEMEIFAGRAIESPVCFIAGKSDWGVYQSPGATDRMRTSACRRLAGFHLIEGAGHWVQQEQPEQVNRILIDFLREHSGSSGRG